MEVTITLSGEQILKIITDELKNGIALLERQLDSRNRNLNAIGVFHSNREKDIAAIENHLLALKTTLDWFEPSWLRNEH